MHSRYFIEVLTPKQTDEDFEESLERFAAKYQAIVDGGFVVSVPDNPMGALHFHALEVIAEMGLPVKPDQVLIHLNTFHTRDALDELLGTALRLGTANVLVVTGDGGERLPKLKPEAIGMAVNSVTSVELLQYIEREPPGRFYMGVAFNQYEPEAHEVAKLKRKLDAGARFAITQPTIAGDRRLGALDDCGVPFAIGAWMSKNLKLLEDCIGYPLDRGSDYDPLANLKDLRRRFPQAGLYLALVGFKTQLPALRELLI
jgi:methylenetetrahydrofolate reductase (NADPH)